MPDKLKEFAAQAVKEYLTSLPAEERLKGLSGEERLKGMSVDEVLRALSPEARKALERTVKANGSGL